MLGNSPNIVSSCRSSCLTSDNHQMQNKKNLCWAISPTIASSCRSSYLTIINWNFYSLSSYSDSGVICSFKPFLLRISDKIRADSVPASKGSEDIMSQWSNTHWGKAWPEVAALNSAENPKDLITGRYALML